MTQALAWVAIVLAIVSLVLQVGSWVLQARQGTRIGMSVMSTVDQVYRRIRTPNPSEYEELAWEAGSGLDVAVSPRFIKPGKTITLALSGWSMNPLFELKVSCIIERPSGQRDELRRVIHPETKESPFNLEVVYPSAEFSGSTLEAGRYHVNCEVTEVMRLTKIPSGDPEVRRETMGSVEGSFYVVP